MTMNRPKKKRRMVPIYDPADILAGKENPKKIGEMSDPDEPGPVIVDYETMARLVGISPRLASVRSETGFD